MENASKALIMAGSILISMVIIASLVFMFNQISTNKQIETDTDEVNKLSDYNKKFEQFNKQTIYGSELLSLANLQEDYNKTQADNQGYKRIEITVKVNKISSIDGTLYFANVNDMDDLLKEKNKIEKEFETYENSRTGKKYEGKTVKYYSQLSSLYEIAKKFNIAYDSDSYIEDVLRNDYKTKDLMKDIDKYKDLKSIYTEFKNKRFRCNGITYDNNGRVEAMSFIQKN